MKIEISNNELKLLIELLYFGHFMFDSSQEIYPEKNEKYDKLLQKIYKIAVQNGMTDLVEPSQDKIYHTIEFEQGEFATSVIDEYENEVFWQELMFQLSERDILDKMTVEEYRSMGFMERIKLETEHEEPYDKEFAENGIRNLRILSPDLPFLKKK